MEFAEGHFAEVAVLAALAGICVSCLSMCTTAKDLDEHMSSMAERDHISAFFFCIDYTIAAACHVFDYEAHEVLRVLQVLLQKTVKQLTLEIGLT